MQTYLDTFSKRLSYIIEYKGFKNANEFGKFLGYKQSEKILRLIRDDNNNPSFEILKDITNKFEDINANWLLNGDGYPFIQNSFDKLKNSTPKWDSLSKKNDKFSQKLNPKKVTYEGNLMGNLTEENKQNVNEDAVEYENKKLITVTVDNNNKENIVLIPIKAAAGYLIGYEDPEFIEELQSFSLPGFIDQTYRAFEISGDSMIPTINNNDWLICSYLESLEQIREGYIYIIVSNDGIVAKRVFKNNNHLELVSDNDFYKPYSLSFKNIKEVWRVTTKISSHLPPPNDTNKRIASLEVVIQEILRKIQ